MAEESLKVKTSRGLFWGGASNLVQQVLNAAFGIYLARTLSAGDYGLVGMLAVFSLLALVLQEGGFSSALINRKGIVHADYNAVFWVSVLVSFAIYAVLFAAAPLIARYFHQPALVMLSRWVFLGFIFSGFAVVQKAYLTKKMEYRKMAIVNMAATVISGVTGVVLAWRGFAYWALVIQALVYSLLSAAGLWVCSDWRPRLQLNFKPVGEMLRFSAKLIMTSAFAIISNNLITVLLGRFYSAVKVGYYTQASKWNGMGSNVLNAMIGGVSQPVLSNVGDDGQRRLRVFRKMVRFTAFISFPAMLGLAFIAPEFITCVLGDKWAESIPLLTILCIGAAFTPLSANYSGLVLSLGRSDRYMLSNILQSTLLLIAVFVCYPYGVEAMVIAISALNGMWVLVWWMLMRRDLGYSLRALLADILPYLGITLVSIAAGWLATKGITVMAWTLVAKIAVTAAVYVLLLVVTGSVAFKESINFILRRERES